MGIRELLAERERLLKERKKRQDAFNKKMKVKNLKREIRELKYPMTASAIKTVKGAGKEAVKAFATGTTNLVKKNLEAGRKEAMEKREAEIKARVAARLKEKARKEKLKKAKAKKPVRKSSKRKKKR